jgi:hypothetical protein
MTYSVELPPGLEVDKRITSPKERAARTKTYTLPQKSWAFTKPGWTLERIKEVDTERYPQVIEILDYWNEQFQNEDRLSPYSYAIIRTLLSEEAIPLEGVKRGIRAARLDPWWADKANLDNFLNKPSRVRQLSKKSTHDRYGRNMDVHPKGEVIAVEF